MEHNSGEENGSQKTLKRMRKAYYKKYREIKCLYWDIFDTGKTGEQASEAMIYMSWDCSLALR